MNNNPTHFSDVLAVTSTFAGAPLCILLAFGGPGIAATFSEITAKHGELFIR
ncbi:hypothetical protein BDN70DRAFT_887559 [Pholiota conissans]|uniref:Uncharacterized protein n=1 Tax=Pholiota conissans TaxID=109636 RepID=A0A9P5YML3_9AGAR|nr:hypothetical protein BDN70DRAFT_887559 [Pholiota conissans]